MRRGALFALLVTLVTAGQLSLYTEAPEGFSLFPLVDHWTTGDSRSPLSAFPYVTSAGFSKLLVVDTNGGLFSINDISQPAPAAVGGFDQGIDFAGLQGKIYMTDLGVNTGMGGIVLVDAGGIPRGHYPIRRLITGVPAEDEYCSAGGITVNPTNKHLYISCGASSTDALARPSIIIDLDPDVLVGLVDESVLDVDVHYSVLVAGPPAFLVPAGQEPVYNFQGLAFSSTYNTLFANGYADDDVSIVFGYAIHGGVQEGMVFQSSVLPPYGMGVAAGTGCLSGFVYASHAAGVTQIDLNGVQTHVLVDSELGGDGGAFGAYLHYDPLDGALLVPNWDQTSGFGGHLYKLLPPSCGGFAGPFRFFAPGEPIGSLCDIDAECSTNHCELGATPEENSCETDGYHGNCQSNVDCGDDVGLWCQLFRRRDRRDSDHDDQPGRKHKHRHDDDDDGPFVPSPWPDLDADFFPARFGVCNLDACANSHGGCDVHADCIPTGDSQRVCKCHDGWYGTGMQNQCRNPCLPNPCDTNAVCSSTSLTATSCTCINNATLHYFALHGTGRPGDCVADPCYGAQSGVCGAAPNVCQPVNGTAVVCRCAPGYWKPANPEAEQCIVDPCASPTACDPHATCAHFADGSHRCTCFDGYFPGGDPGDVNPPCIASRCRDLTPPAFPFFVQGGVVGTCENLVTGQTCQVGCADGYRAEGRVFTTCVGAPGSNSSYYSVPRFECIPDARDVDRRGGRRRDDDNDGRFNVPRVPQPLLAWECPRGGSCRPYRPIAVRSSNGLEVSLRWLPLGSTSPNGDNVDRIRVGIAPSTGGFYYSSDIARPNLAEGVTLTNLQHGVQYTFKLVVTLNGNTIVASDPVVA